VKKAEIKVGVEYALGGATPSWTEHHLYGRGAAVVEEIGAGSSTVKITRTAPIERPVGQRVVLENRLLLMPWAEWAAACKRSEAKAKAKQEEGARRHMIKDGAAALVKEHGGKPVELSTIRGVSFLVPPGAVPALLENLPDGSERARVLVIYTVKEPVTP